jgi:hypothetical protein
MLDSIYSYSLPASDLLNVSIARAASRVRSTNTATQQTEKCVVTDSSATDQRNDTYTASHPLLLR